MKKITIALTTALTLSLASHGWAAREEPADPPVVVIQGDLTEDELAAELSTSNLWCPSGRYYCYYSGGTQYCVCLP